VFATTGFHRRRIHQAVGGVTRLRNGQCDQGRQGAKDFFHENLPL
jgi:hypothetical protein